MRHDILWVSLFLMGVLLVGCGTTDKTTAPVDSNENPFTEATVGTDSTLEVVTWNMEHFPKNGQATVDYLVQAVQALDADIYCFQEIESFLSFSKAKAALPNYDGYRADSAGYDINLAVLYKTDGGLTVDSIYEILTDDGAFPRNPLVLQGSYAGKPIVVIDNHFKCCGDNTIDLNDNWDEETRRYHASLSLQQYIQENLNGQRVIVVGDFNDELTDPLPNNVFKNFLDDPQEFRFADLSIAEGPDSGWSYPGWPSHLDHILITEPLFPSLDCSAGGVQVIRLYDYLPGGWATYDRNISDHLPEFVRLKL